MHPQFGFQHLLQPSLRAVVGVDLYEVSTVLPVDPPLPFDALPVFLLGVGVPVDHEPGDVPVAVRTEVFDVDVRASDMEIGMILPVSGIVRVDFVRFLVPVGDAVHRQIIGYVRLPETLHLLPVEGD